MSWDENKRQEILTQYQSKVNEYNTLKNKKFNAWTLALFCCPVVFIIWLVIDISIALHDESTIGNVAMSIFVTCLFISLPIILIGREISKHKKNKQLTKLENEIDTLNSNGYTFISEYLCNLFNINEVMLLDELNLLSKSYGTLVMKSTKTNVDIVHNQYTTTTSYNFWQNVDCINGVQDLLSRKFKGIDFDNKSHDLKLENLKLQNESIAIDNNQKKFWTCQFCGNINRADDMSCLKCGGIRPSLNN